MSVRLSDWRIVAWMSSDRLPDRGGGVIFLARDAFHSLAKSSLTVHIRSRASFRGSAERARAPACILVRAVVQREALMMAGVSCSLFPFLQDTPEGPALASEGLSPDSLQTVALKLSSQVFELTLGFPTQGSAPRARRFRRVQLPYMRIRTTCTILRWSRRYTANLRCTKIL